MSRTPLIKKMWNIFSIFFYLKVKYKYSVFYTHALNFVIKNHMVRITPQNIIDDAF